MTAQGWAQHYRRQLSTLARDIVIGDPGPALMFDDRVYKRGALTLHAVRSTIGDELFFTVLREWTARHRERTATTDDFCALAGEISGSSLEELFRRWLFETALPRLP
jgi:aminopeptidase